MKALCISAVASNAGKTILTTALLKKFTKSVRPYKIGPDYIDPQFHEKICSTPSINLDNFMMNKEQINWLFNKYNDKDIAILEGVMGFYDGMDKGSSTYDVTKNLNIPTVLLLDGSGSYITVSAVLKGLKTYKEDNTIKAVILNKISSDMHYSLIKNQIETDFKDIKVLGWIKKDLPILSETHLGLDLKELNKETLLTLSNQVLENIDLEKLESIATFKANKISHYPFENLEKIDKKISIIKDSNFSFIYYDNIEVLKSIFTKVEFISATNNESISEDSHLVYIPGGYVETKNAYDKIKNSSSFKKSLIRHAKSKYIYAECAGLLYLGRFVDEKIMSGVLDVSFNLTNKRTRLGYYYNESGIKGHAFHYTIPTSYEKGFDILSKKVNGKGTVGSWKFNKVFATYLHIMFRNNIKNIKENFGI